MAGLRAVDLDDDGVKGILDGSLFNGLKQKINMKAYTLSTGTLSISTKIDEDNISFLYYNKI